MWYGSKISEAGYRGTISVFFDGFLRCLQLAKCLLWSRHVYMKSHGCGFQYHCSRQNSPGQSPIQLLYVWYYKYVNTLDSPSAWSSVRGLFLWLSKQQEHWSSVCSASLAFLSSLKHTGSPVLYMRMIGPEGWIFPWKYIQEFIMVSCKQKEMRHRIKSGINSKQSALFN